MQKCLLVDSAACRIKNRRGYQPLLTIGVCCDFLTYLFAYLQNAKLTPTVLQLVDLSVLDHVSMEFSYRQISAAAILISDCDNKVMRYVKGMSIADLSNVHCVHCDDRLRRLSWALK